MAKAKNARYAKKSSTNNAYDTQAHAIEVIPVSDENILSGESTTGPILDNGVIPVDSYNIGSAAEALGPHSTPDAGEPITTQDGITSIPKSEIATQNIQDVNSPLNQGGKMNANLNFNDYGDDSSPENQTTPGGLREKNTGEGVATSNIAYNPNADINNLNYKYGEEGRQENAKSAGYLARRNDEIASALYNAGLVEKSDIIQYLANQPGWNNSTEADRVNTVESIWKRLGGLGQQNNAEQGGVDTTAMEENIRGEDTSGTLYGKDTPHEGNPEGGIPALSDANSIFASIQESRIAKVKELLSMSTDAIAAAIYGGELSEGTQQMRDYQENYPQLYAEVQTKLKQYKGQGTIDAITNGGEIPTNTNGTSGINNSIADFASENAGYSESMQDILKDVHQTISSNSSASAANDAMADMEEEMVALTKRLKNLDKEAQSVFKGDVPDYIVKAYINNRTQEIQDKLSTLSERYKYASNRYDKEVENAKWQKEYDLKERQVKIQEESLALDWWKTKNGVATTNPDNKGTTNPGDKYQVTTMSDSEVASAVDELLTMYDNGQIGNAQCGVGIQKYYLPMLGISLNNISSFENKKALINEGEDYIPKKGDLIILSSKSSPENGHIGIVLGVHSDGTIEYMDWNGSLGADGKGTEKVAINGININDSKIQGFRNVNKSSESSLGYNEAYAPYYQKLLDADYTAMSWPEKTAKDLGYSSVDEFRNAAFAWNDAEQKRIQEELKDKAATWTRKDGTVFNITDTPTYDSLTYDQKNIVQQLLNLNKNPSTVTKRQYGDDFEKILSAVKEINPNWSDADFGQADKVIKEWNTSTKNGSNSRNGTAIATAKDIYDIADKFGNAKWKDWNGMLNKFRDKLSDEEYTKMLINLEVLASEYAGALKGNNAAPTEQEIEDKKNILALNLGSGAMKTASKEIAKTLYNKNANEAQNYLYATLKKAPLIVTEDVADWMYNVVGLTEMPNLYDYNPKGARTKTNTKPNAPKVGTGSHKGQSIGDALTM